VQQTLLAIDDVSLPFRKNVGLYLSKPAVRAEPVLAPAPFGSGAPDDSAAHFYGTVLHDEGRFRMWYYASHWGINPDWPPRMMQQIARPPGGSPVQGGPICYAESDDGIHWTKPALGQVLFKGSRANNAIAIPHARIGTVNIIKDTADPDPARRYKMVYEYLPDQNDPPIPEYGCVPTIALAISADGLHWTVTSIPFKNQFVEESSFIKHDGQYIVHYHVLDAGAGWLAEGGTPCGRTGVARVSYDWDVWPDLIAEAFALAEPEDRSLRGMNGPYDQVHLGVGAASFGNVCIGLYGLWHNVDNAGAFDKVSCDLGLLISNDGIHFREPVKGHRFLRRQDSLATPVPGRNFNTVLCQSNGILNVGEQTLIYHGRWRMAGGFYGTDDDVKYYSGEVGLATLPRDRWGALGLNPGANEGTACTAPILFSENAQVILNADGVEAMRVEILDERFTPLPEFSGPRSGTVARAAGPGGLRCPVVWPANTLPGKLARLRVTTVRGTSPEPRLYAIDVKT
jgi:hypothetical protein